jgi:DNA helicase HerA-like ATPase
MSIASTVINRSVVRTPLAALINDRCVGIGGIFRLDYHSAMVLTDDFRKHRAGGVPQGGFLLAAAGVQSTDGFVLDDEEVILLRVRGTAPLPNESDLVQTRLAVVRDAATTGRGFDDVTDVLTRNELQQSAFDCEVIGTFYQSIDGTKDIEFGADIDNVVSSAKYQVFLPSERVLSWVASYPGSSSESDPPDDLLVLGVVRFSSTMRRARSARIANAAVRVHVNDFVSRKTAVFGMTRTGKSNTIKTLVTAVFRHGVQNGQRIGQLIFDPQGEYANVNDQDKTGLRLLGDTANEVCIYKMVPNDRDPREKPLRINFLDPNCFETVWEMVKEEVATSLSAQTQYMAGIRSISMILLDPDDHSARNHLERNRLAFYAWLHRAGISGSLTNVSLTLTNDIVSELTSPTPKIPGISGQRMTVSIGSTTAAAALLDWLLVRYREQADSGFKGNKLTKSWIEDIEEKELGDILKAMSGGAGDAAIKRIRSFHDASAVGEIGQRVWNDMQVGKLVVVDLSQGNDTVAKSLSERVVTTLLDNAREEFAANREPKPFQIVVEEAHNLFERNKRETESDPWVRLSKEAAKYKIGMMYATQEVSSVDQRVLSNTSNWLVAHLNSDNETRELSHYYDFKTWSDSIRKCEDVGFVRMKTYSGKYIVPVQIAKFDHEMINSARQQAGLEPVLFPTDT